MELIPVFIYGGFLTFILLYSFSELILLFNYFKRKKREVHSIQEKDLPLVTIQLPVYNEKLVVGRLLDSVSSINYPKDRMHIQVLDDSTDETTGIIADKLKRLKDGGWDVDHLRRENREGFKAGALKYGLERAKGELIVIFDADFLPPVDFLRKTVPYFQDPKIGVVQSRWGHVNEDYSLMTRLQAMGLDAHFILEQTGRNKGGHFINFNGTAGVWRKDVISDAGGWSADTLTEDLDLSYRAQLKGWEFVYLEELVSPAELPVEMNALKNQQFRWSKGAAECARKNLGALWNSDKSFPTKWLATFHLMNSFLFICIVFIGMLTLPVILVTRNFPEHQQLYSLFVIYYLGLLIITVFYATAYLLNKKNKIVALISFLFLFPIFLSVSLGLSLNNAIGVLEGYLGKKSPFVRTPKYNVEGRKGTFLGNPYNLKSLPSVVWMEGFLLAFFIFCFYVAFLWKSHLSLPFFGMLIFGFGFVFFTSLIHFRKG